MSIEPIESMVDLSTTLSKTEPPAVSLVPEASSVSSPNLQHVGRGALRLIGEKDDLEQVIVAAGAGNEQAWEVLHERFVGLTKAVARNHRLDGDEEDISQQAWEVLFKRLNTIEQPDKLAAWLRTTTQNLCLHGLQRKSRTQEIPTDFSSFSAITTEPLAIPFDSAKLEADELSQNLRVAIEALAEISPNQYRLIKFVLENPEASYADISSALDMPHGSLGPTRKRATENIRQLLVGLGYEIDAHETKPEEDIAAVLEKHRHSSANRIEPEDLAMSQLCSPQEVKIIRRIMGETSLAATVDLPEAFQQGFEALSDIEKSVILLRYGLQPKTQQNTAEILGTWQPHIHRIEHRALAKMKAVFVANSQQA